MTKAMRRAAFFILLALGAVPCALAQAGPPSTPEPGSIALVGLGLVAGATLLYRSRRNKR